MNSILEELGKGYVNVDKNAFEALQNLALKYELLAVHWLNEDTVKTFIGTNNKFCRFCKKGSPEVTFDKDAHALPHCIGNNVLFFYNECDTCNHKFGRVLENHFANFMNLNHTIGRVKGKKGLPNYKIDGVYISNNENLIDWTDVPPENIHHDPENKMVYVKQKMPSFIPVGLYKCLVKMALTLMPESELINFKHTLSWINEEKHNETMYKFESLCLFHGNVSTSLSFPGISAILVKRKASTDTNNPYIMFRVLYGSYMFQVPIPLCERDEVKGFSQFPFIPTPTDLKFGFNKLQLGLMNLWSTEMHRGMEMIVALEDLDGSGTIEFVDV